MQEESNNYLGFGMFFFLIVLFILLGSILLFFNASSKMAEKKTNDFSETLLDDRMKMDKNKDFIYFTEEEILSEEMNLIFKIPIVNLKVESVNQVNEEIKQYANSIKMTLQKGDTSLCMYTNTDIYSTNFLEYAIYNYQEYATLLIRESSYTCENGFSSSNKVKSYTFNILTGERLNFNALLVKYNANFANVLEKIRIHLNETQTIVEDIPNILIEETLQNLKEQETYVFYIDEFGDLILNYVVKTNSVDYNDTIVINGR